MSLAEFTEMQTAIWDQFGWLARWWLIGLVASGVLLSALMFFLTMISSWLETWAS